MKKILPILLIFIVTLSACSTKSKEISLDSENIKDYVFINYFFEDNSIYENEQTLHNEKYYITCLMTIKVKPRSNYLFSNTSVSCVINDGGIWSPITASNNKITGIDLLYKWYGIISLDKNGYGETTVMLFCYADSYDKLHPSNASWECYILDSSGTAKAS